MSITKPIKVKLSSTVTVDLMPSYKSLLALERDLGKSLGTLMTGLSQNPILGIEEVVAIIYNGGLPETAEIGKDEIGELVFNKGFTTLFEPCGKFLEAAVTGPKKTKATKAAKAPDAQG